MIDIPGLAGLALSTLISEDLASISAGILSAEGRIPIVHAILACVAGVYFGDLGLWAAGRLIGLRSGPLDWLTHRLGRDDLSSMGSHIDAHLGLAVLVSRFVPGGRLPMYLAAGIWGRRPFAFAAWSLLAVTLWTPLLVVSAAVLGQAVVAPLLTGFEAGVFGSLLTGLTVWGLVKLGGRAVAVTARRYHHRLDQTIETPN